MKAEYLAEVVRSAQLPDKRILFAQNRTLYEAAPHDTFRVLFCTDTANQFSAKGQLQVVANLGDPTQTLGNQPGLGLGPENSDTQQQLKGGVCASGPETSPRLQFLFLIIGQARFWTATGHAHRHLQKV
jgi:hypothetical protein